MRILENQFPYFSLRMYQTAYNSVSQKEGKTIIDTVI